MLDTEALFERMAAEAWTDALDLVHREPDRLADDAVTRAALGTLSAEVGRRVAGSELDDEAVERYLLLGRAGRLPVSRDQEARAVESLLHRYRDSPARAVSIARFRPDIPGAISVIAQFGSPDITSCDTGQDGHRVTAAHAARTAAGAGRSLFRSVRERAFYEAALRVYPGAIVQANVALHAALDFESVKGRLTADERRTFFSALVDSVVFDPGIQYRPIRFFELDSALHDDAARVERDRIKDRIVSAAGHHLVRIRPADTDAADDPETYERVLRHLESENSIYSADPESRSDP